MEFYEIDRISGELKLEEFYASAHRGFSSTYNFPSSDYRDIDNDFFRLQKGLKSTERYMCKADRAPQKF